MTTVILDEWKGGAMLIYDKHKEGTCTLSVSETPEVSVQYGISNTNDSITTGVHCARSFLNTVEKGKAFN